MRYQEKYTEQIVFPLGGIGSGSIGLAGNGMLVDWEIFNRPAKGSRNRYSHIAIKAQNKDRVVTKVLNGDQTRELMGMYGHTGHAGYGYGPLKESMCGFPHFKKVTFDGEFPVARLTFEDHDFPGKVVLTAFNPFIPLDEDNSSIPAAFFEIEVENDSRQDWEYQIAFSVMNPFEKSENRFVQKEGYSMILLKNSGVSEQDGSYGDLTIATDSRQVLRQTYWYRGNWQDNVTAFWNDFQGGEDVQERIYDHPGEYDGSTLIAKMICEGEEKKSARFVLSWNVPNCYNYWTPGKEKQTWKNYYAVLFKDSAQSARYALQNWIQLYQRTLEFKNALFESSLDQVIIEAVSATMSVLKSATVLRLEDGSFYGWEGVREKDGSCEGTCQHVWNYAYALCFLFPGLERSIRDLEFRYCTDEDGWMVFRLKLPLGSDRGTMRACLDGQMGSVIKCYREWKVSGDDDWLRKNWKNIVKILEYAWSKKNPDQWDRNKDGVLEGRQHHTLDMELFGPSSWLQSMYLAALKAGAEMAEYLGEKEKAREYTELFQKGYAWTRDNLFNGSYFIHKIDLKDKSVPEHFDCLDLYWNEEKEEIKYQIGEGSEIDQMLGQWHCTINGLGEIFERDQIEKALDSMMKNHYKPSMRNFTNPWRIFSLNDEAGSVMCDYPQGSYKPYIPVPYCEETMHGFEYQFAGLLFAYGRIEDGIKVVKAVRDKYDGHKRNPWNEMECGSNYARSMASFAFLPILSGLCFHLPEKSVGFQPLVDRKKFKCLFSLGTGWGILEIDELDANARITIKEGSLQLKEVKLGFAEKVTGVMIDGRSVPYVFEKGRIHFEECTVKQAVEICYE